MPPPVVQSVDDVCDSHIQSRLTREMLDQPLMSAWQALAERCQTSPYLDPGWLSCWWPAFGTGEIEIRTLWRQGRLAAVLPMARRSGHLESTSNYHTPLFGILAEDEPAAVSMARELFRDAPARVTLATLDPEGATLEACKEAAEEAGYRVVLRPHLLSPYVDLRYGWNEYQRNLHSHLQRNLRRGRRQLEEIGPLKVEIVSGTEALDEHLDEAFEVEASGWKGKSGTAIQSRAHTRLFYQRMAHWAAGQGALRLYLLRLGTRVLTMCLTLQRHDHCCMMKGGYDEEFKRFSPGNLLTEALIKDCAGRGIKRVEIYGEAETYKLNWATGTIQYMRLEAFAPTLAGRMAWMKFRYGRPVTSRVRQALHLQQPGHRQ
ncbi:MAG TPA: GNAT family N-acetyltransferase [Gammaproteobacteria bacterium]|jgi:CelD/BcsL family acetyltransferase involved in cellulose biosynthesis